MASDVDNLLAAEEAVQDVLKELHALKRQVSGYDTATQTLEAVRLSLDDLVAKTSALAERTHSATTTLGNIGTPEILTRAENIKSAISELAAASAKQSSELASASAKQMRSVRSTATAALLFSILSVVASIVILTKLFMR